jgi:hypothetical protein
LQFSSFFRRMDSACGLGKGRSKPTVEVEEM